MSYYPDWQVSKIVGDCIVEKGDEIIGMAFSQLPDPVENRKQRLDRARMMAMAPELLDALKMAYANIPRPTMLDKNAAERMATLAHISELIAKIESNED